MKKKGYIITIGSVLLLTVGAIVTNSVLKRKREREEFERKLQEMEDLSQEEINRLREQFEQEKESAIEEVVTVIDTKKVGNYAYPKSSSVTIRQTAEIDDGEGLFNADNILVENHSKRVGVIVKELLKESAYGQKYKWYEVKLDTPVTDYLPYPKYFKNGFVRADQVTVKRI